MNPSILFLGLAIISEVIGTSALKVADGFSRGIPSLVVVAGYGFAFFFLSLALRTIPVGVAYAIWSGVGTAGLAIIGWVVFKEQLSGLSILGILLIILGVLALHVAGAGAGRH
jgi:small multidrug resistance pump